MRTVRQWFLAGFVVLLFLSFLDVLPPELAMISLPIVFILALFILIDRQKKRKKTD